MDRKPFEGLLFRNKFGKYFIENRSFEDFL